MTIEIKNRYTNKVIYSSDKAKDIKECVEEAIKARVDLSSANLFGVDLSSANLSEANLSSANLSRANLFGVNLSRANLSRANLFGVNLSGVNLSGVNLSGATGFNKYLVTPLLMLKDQPGNIILYKLVNSENKGYLYPSLDYSIGNTVKERKAQTDESIQCGEGINVCTLDWALKNWREGYKILKVQFTAKDIAAIPINTDGKIRLFKCKVIGEVDLKAIGFLDERGKRI